MINIVYTLQIKATSTRVEHSESGRIRIIFYNSDPQQNMDPDPESDLAFENMTKREEKIRTFEYRYSTYERKTQTSRIP